MQQELVQYATHLPMSAVVGYGLVDVACTRALNLIELSRPD